MTRLCILFTAVAVIARTRVPVLPGWVVPAPVIVLAVVGIACGAAVTMLVLRARTRPRPAACPPVLPSGGAR